MENRIILQMDKTALKSEILLGHDGECRANSNLQRYHNVYTDRGDQEQNEIAPVKL